MPITGGRTASGPSGRPVRGPRPARPPSGSGVAAWRVRRPGTTGPAARPATTSRGWTAPSRPLLAVARGPAGARVLLVAFGVGALGLAAVTDQPAHRIWGLLAGTGYLLLAVTPLGRPAAAPWSAGAVCGLVPLAVLVLARGGAPGPGPFAQPEVWVIEDAARRWLATGTPYPSAAQTAAAAGPDGYFPYLPGMALFGMPRALLGDAWWTDARLTFAAVAVAGCAVGVPAVAPRVGPATGWLVAGNPLVALTTATGGHDMALAGLLVAAVGLTAAAVTGAGATAAGDPRVTVAAGVLAGVASGVKPTAWPVVLVLLVLLAGAGGRGAAPWFAAATAGPALLLCLPDLLRAPGLVAEHLVAFPAGLAAVPTPAAGPLPGAWVAALPGGRTIALGLLLVAVLVAAGWMLVRPPAGAAAAARFAAAGLTVGMLLAPSSRAGWFVVPLLLAGQAAAQRDPRT